MRIRHTVIFTFYESTTEAQVADVVDRLEKLGEYNNKNLGVTDWVVQKHIPETFKPGRAHLIQDGIFPDIDSLKAHGESPAHKHVIELTPKVCDWMAIDYLVE